MRATVGFALCGSFCTFRKAIDALRALTAQYTVVPIFSDAAWETDTRFGASADFRAEVTALCGTEPLHTLAQVEPLGPKHLLDLLIVAPCTGNTLGKLANGIADSPVSFACKAHLRNGRPVLLAVSTNDGLSGSAANLGALLARRHFYFVPFGQDSPTGKPALWHIFPCCQRRPRQRCGVSSSSRCSSEGLQKQAAADIIGTRSK